MKHGKLTGKALLAIYLTAATAASVTAQEREDTGRATTQGDDASKSDVQTTGKRAARAMPVYTPPQRGAPKARVGGGTRGTGDSAPYITVITPPDLALSASSQPVLFWYLSGQLSNRFELALINDQSIEPVMELALDSGLAPGIHAVDLSDHDIRLQPGRSYQWSVVAVVDPDHRSSDILSSARLEYVEADAGLRDTIEQATPEQAVSLYAGSGYWYDAFATLTQLIDEHPENPVFRQQRISLLEQAGLPVVSQYDLHNAGDPQR